MTFRASPKNHYPGGRVMLFLSTENGISTFGIAQRWSQRLAAEKPFVESYGAGFLPAAKVFARRRNASPPRFNTKTAAA